MCKSDEKIKMIKTLGTYQYGKQWVIDVLLQAYNTWILGQPNTL